MMLHEVIMHPVLSEKSMMAEGERQYIFRVNSKANKHQIREAVQSIYGVSVDQVRVLIMPAKTRRRGRRVFVRQPKWKKAIISVAEGDSINLYDSN
jgi:large subunit ribosomal protein L23